VLSHIGRLNMRHSVIAAQGLVDSACPDCTDVLQPTKDVGKTQGCQQGESATLGRKVPARHKGAHKETGDRFPDPRLSLSICVKSVVEPPTDYHRKAISPAP
jgi:hypothetical protein